MIPLSADILRRIDAHLRHLDALLHSGRLRATVHDKLTTEITDLRREAAKLADRDAVTEPDERAA